MMRRMSLSVAIACSIAMGANAQQNEQLYTVNLEPLSQVIHLDGVVQPINQGTVAAQTSGRIVSLNVDVNDYVKEGAVLLEISAVQQSASLDAAQAQLSSAEAQNREAQAQLKRFTQLFPKGAISQDQMDSAQARARSAAASVKSAQANVEQAKELLGYTSVTAPYDGIVTKRHVELGETVAPGTPLLSGYALNVLRVETDIPQRYQARVETVDQFQVVAPSGEEIAPTDMSLFSYADPQSHTFKIRLSLPENTDAVVPGMWVKTEFVYGEKETLVIPSTAVLRRGELSSVYRIQNQQRVLNPVRLGQEYGDYVEVLSGLEEGDVISTVALAPKGE